MYKLDEDKLAHAVKKTEIEEMARLLHGWQRNLYVGGDDAGGGPKYRRLHFHMISRFCVLGIFGELFQTLPGRKT